MTVYYKVNKVYNTENKDRIAYNKENKVYDK